ncbi:MAG: hypothetical protein P8M70_11915 [Verrucomicrobiota bacterium]|nr:hypothetical protein [Verrucomicrobiota bacterium]
MKEFAFTLIALILTGCTNPPAQPTVDRVNGVPVYQKSAKAKSGKTYTYSESPAAPLDVLFTADQAKAILDEFEVAYAKLGAPKIDVRVNLPQGAVQVPQVPIVTGGGVPAIDPATGLPIPGVGGAVAGGAIPAPTRIFDTDELATQQTKREVERLFGRPLRMAGVKLVDADRTNLPEVSFEVLLSERKLDVIGIRGNTTHTVPDIQVTALRVADGSIIGQATVLDLFPQRASAARMLKRYDIRQLTEATALALMKDMSATTQ